MKNEELDYNEKVADGDISFVAITENGKVINYEIFLSWNNGSGVTVTGDTKEECAKKALDYLLDGLSDAERM